MTSAFKKIKKKNNIRADFVNNKSVPDVAVVQSSCVFLILVCLFKDDRRFDFHYSI